MNTRMLLAGAAAGIVGFLLGWVLFDMVLGSYYAANMIQYDGLMRAEEELNLYGIFFANLIFGILIAWCCWRMGATGLTNGLMTGAMIGFLVYASMDIFFYSMMNMYASPLVMLVDILANTVWAGSMGAAAGLVLAKGSSRATGTVAA